MAGWQPSLMKMLERLNRHPLLINAVLLSFIVVYSFIGGLIFRTIERGRSGAGTASGARFGHGEGASQQEIAQCVMEIINDVTAEKNKLGQQGWINLTEAEAALQECAGYLFEELEWSPLRAALFCFGVITTLGVGNPAPVTRPGRVFCIVFGLIGIPIAMLILANIGKWLKESYGNLRHRLQMLWNRYKRRRKRTGQESPVIWKTIENKESTNQPAPVGADTDDGNAAIPVATDDADESIEPEEQVFEATAVGVLLIFLMYAALGSVLIMYVDKDVDFVSALYFVFLSLTALEFRALIKQRNALLPLLIAYVCIGIAITTLAIDVGSDYLRMLHHFGKPLSNSGQVWIWFGGKRVKAKEYAASVISKFGIDVRHANSLNYDRVAQTAIEISEGKFTKDFQGYEWAPKSHIPEPMLAIDDSDEDEEDKQDPPPVIRPSLPTWFRRLSAPILQHPILWRKSTTTSLPNCFTNGGQQIGNDDATMVISGSTKKRSVESQQLRFETVLEEKEDNSSLSDSPSKGGTEYTTLLPHDASFSASGRKSQEPGVTVDTETNENTPPCSVGATSRSVTPMSYLEDPDDLLQGEIPPRVPPIATALELEDLASLGKTPSPKSAES